MRKRFLGLLSVLCALALAVGFMPARAQAAEAESYVALGDSISTGYGLTDPATEGFVSLVADQQGYDTTNLAVDGAASYEVLALVTDVENASYPAIAGADVITISVGGNDLLNALYMYLADQYSTILGVPVTPELIATALAAEDPDPDMVEALLPLIEQFATSQQAADALASFSQNLTGIIGAVKTANPDATILVLNQYNPFSFINNPDVAPVNTAFETAANALNGIISAGAGSSTYTVVDVYGVLSDAQNNPFNASFASLTDFNLDIHPNAYGHQLIAAAVNAVIDILTPEDPDPNPGVGFVDVPEDEWFYNAVMWAAATGTMTGYDDGSNTFGPNNPMTRAEMATVLYRIAGEPAVDTSILPDDCDPEEWYAAPVAWALTVHVFNGYDDGTFGPDAWLTREQAACVLMNAAAILGVDVTPRTDLSTFPDADDVSDWAADSLSWAVASHIINGYELEDGTRELQPGRACTRAELAGLMMNLLAGE